MVVELNIKIKGEEKWLWWGAKIRPGGSSGSSLHIKQGADEQTGVGVSTLGKWAPVPRYIDMYIFKGVNPVLRKQLLTRIKTVVMSAAAVWLPFGLWILLFFKHCLRWLRLRQWEELDLPQPPA